MVPAVYFGSTTILYFVEHQCYLRGADVEALPLLAFRLALPLALRIALRLALHLALRLALRHAFPHVDLQNRSVIVKSQFVETAYNLLSRNGSAIIVG